MQTALAIIGGFLRIIIHCQETITTTQWYDVSKMFIYVYASFGDLKLGTLFTNQEI